MLIKLFLIDYETKKTQNQTIKNETINSYLI